MFCKRGNQPASSATVVCLMRAASEMVGVICSGRYMLYRLVHRHRQPGYPVHLGASPWETQGAGPCFIVSPLFSGISLPRGGLWQDVSLRVRGWSITQGLGYCCSSFLASDLVFRFPRQHLRVASGYARGCECTRMLHNYATCRNRCRRYHLSAGPSLFRHRRAHQTLWS